MTRDDLIVRGYFGTVVLWYFDSLSFRPKYRNLLKLVKITLEICSMSGELRSRFRGDFLVRKKKKAGRITRFRGPTQYISPEKGRGYDVMRCSNLLLTAEKKKTSVCCVSWTPEDADAASVNGQDLRADPSLRHLLCSCDVMSLPYCTMTTHLCPHPATRSQENGTRGGCPFA